MRIVFPKKADGYRALNIWSLYFCIKSDFMRRERGWRSINFGILKITSRPPEGMILSKKNYKGFMVSWFFWLPFEGGK